MICLNQVDVTKYGGTMHGCREVLNMKNGVPVG